MKIEAMDIETFRDCLDCHGPGLERWPDDVRAAGRALMERDIAAAALWRDAQRLDAALLRSVPVAGMDAAALGRLVAGLERRRPQEVAAAVWRPRAAAAVTLGAVALFSVGAWIGVVTNDAADVDPLFVSLDDRTLELGEM